VPSTAAVVVNRMPIKRRLGSAFSSFIFFGVGVGSAYYLSDELSLGQTQQWLQVKKGLNQINQ
jgi:hypothetical protein